MKTAKKKESKPSKPSSTKVAKPTAPATASLVKKSKKRSVLPRKIRRLVTHRRTLPLWYKIKRRAKKLNVAPETLIKRKPKYAWKKVSGEKNGKVRLVRIKKEKRFYPTEPRPKKRRTGRVCFRSHKRKFKKGIAPGRVVILLAGRHKGKRVVVLKKMPSGLLLITGPHKINGCPLRRMHQMFTIVTSVKLKLKGLKVPEHINDKYFKLKKIEKKKAKGKARGEGDIFASKAKKYKPGFQRRKDQVDIDKQIIEVIRKHRQKKLLLAYLGSYFYLRNHMYPHKMKF